MTKKDNEVKEIIEVETIAINKDDIMSEDKISENDVIDVKADNVITEDKKEKVALKILIAFTDKYDDDIHYAVNDIVKFEKARADELLKDTRKLVCISK